MLNGLGPMLPPKKKTEAPSETELLKVFAGLDAQNQASLLSYARFLQAEQGPLADNEAQLQHPLSPEPIERPPEESVVAAIRRLSKTYFMLNKDELLHSASGLMSAHVLQGRPAQEVIDELESLFSNAYADYQASHQKTE